MSLSTTQYGYIVDPMVPFTDDKGKTIKNGFIRVFMAGTSTPVITYRNYDGATNQEKIELDNSGRVKHNVIGSKGSLYKVVVYNILHSQENPLLTVDKIAVLGASIDATGATIVTGLDSVTVQEKNFLKATVEGTGVELALDPTEVTSEVSTNGEAETAATDYVVPLLDKTGTGDSKKISLANIFKFALDWISRLATTITSFVSGDFIAVSNPTDGSRKMKASTLLELTAQNALAGNVAPEFDPTRTSENPYKAGESVAYEGKTYTFKVDHYGPWAAADVDEAPAVTSKLDCVVIIDDPEYMLAFEDKQGVFLLGIRKDGSVDWQEGIPVPVKDELAKIHKVTDMFTSVADDESILYKIVDAKGTPLLWITKRGEICWQSGVPEPIESRLRTLEKINSFHSEGDFDGNVEAVVDEKGRVIETTSKNGERNFETKVNFRDGINWDSNLLDGLESALRSHGFSGGGGDWTDKDYISLPKPRCAIVNFTGLESFPLQKGSDVPCVMEFWDGNGNYFKKFAIVNPQGNSTLQWPKKNIAVDLFNDEAREESCKVKFGEWPAFDSYHIKAYYNDFFRCVGCISYDLIDEMWKSRGPLHDAPWKDALIDQANYPEGRLMFGGETDYSLRQDTGALCHPMGFPSVVYLNGEFWGVMPFQIKKHRDNYHQKKSNTKHIHLDGVLGNGNLWGAEGNVVWTAFEIRNPKDLIDMDGNKYDGDDPKELIDSTSPAWTGSSKQVNTQKVKQAVLAASEIAGELADAATAYGVNSSEFKSVFETYYDVDNIIDWAIFLDFWQNNDGIVNNTQWITYNGVKWWATPYDIDIAFGWYSPYILNNTTAPLGRDNASLPIKYIFANDEYRARAEARYKFLRDKGILSLDNVVSKIGNYVKNVGMDLYEKEYEKWPDTSSDRDTAVNTEYWSLDLDGEGKPIYSDSRTWDASAEYGIGDQVYQGHNTEMGFVRFTAVKAGTGKDPIAEYGVRDSIWRLAKWMERHIGRCDANYNYT